MMILLWYHHLSLELCMFYQLAMSPDLYSVKTLTTGVQQVCKHMAIGAWIGRSLRPEKTGTKIMHIFYESWGKKDQFN